ncbi:chemotaxis protein CheA [Psychromonas ossibalaenae]|uniref:chemotaxis protein CheA n=1 Tax=Psychromonas ossibalaenae TaxID=444922 RepID=UPI0003616961|nr:chemotaxis protein CheA [Psychromonas ossibalaenae]
MNDLDAALITFTQEAQELLDEMESSLLVLEDTPDDAEVINCVFRAMHTIKGSSGLFGFNHIVSFTHQAETVLDQVRDGSRQIDAQLISVLLDCRDHTARLLAYSLEYPDQPLEEELQRNGELLSECLTPTQSSAVKGQARTENIELENTSEEKNSADLNGNWLITLLFKKDAFRMGVDPLSFIRYLKTLGEIRALLLFDKAVPEGDEFDPESCYLHYKIAFSSEADKQQIEDVFEFAADDCEIKILAPSAKSVEYLALLEDLPEDEIARLGEMLVKVGVLTVNDVARALHTQGSSQEECRPLGEILVEQNVIQPKIIEQAIKKQQQVKQKVSSESNYIRVDSTKLGHLINLVGELVISGAAMDLMIEKSGLDEAEEVSATMSSLVSNIRDTALELRMVPIGETFSRFRRVVRDVSKELGKNIDLEITGGETELDKTVVEKINDPLTHLIRNSLDHGIESPEQRLAAGKSEQGSIHLNAFHDSGHIVIQIVDDGAGLNKDKILEKAVAKGIVTEEANLSDQEIYNLIFAAGLSTKKQASDLSGRGVGMDVVRRNIEGLRGSVNIDSIEHQGTKITIQLPLTLAIIDGFMVGADGERYIIPLSMVEECVEMNEKEWQLDAVQNYVNLRGSAMPYLKLSEYFNPGKQFGKRSRQSLVVVRVGKERAGFVVDELHGEQQTVIKPLGQIFENIEGLSGATVLGDGNVALILNVKSLINKVTVV